MCSDFRYKFQRGTKVLAHSRLASHVWAKYKDEIPDVPGYNENIETSYTNRVKLTKLKDLCFFFKKNKTECR